MKAVIMNWIRRLTGWAWDEVFDDLRRENTRLNNAYVSSLTRNAYLEESVAELGELRIQLIGKEAQIREMTARSVDIVRRGCLEDGNTAAFNLILKQALWCALDKLPERQLVMKADPPEGWRIFFDLGDYVGVAPKFTVRASKPDTVVDSRIDGPDSWG